MEYQIMERGGNASLYVCQCGWEICDCGHQYGPAVRPYHLFHFVASGHGTFWTDDASYALGPGQGFAIFPGQLTTYRADDGDPWVYAWVGYAGHDAALLTHEVGLTPASPICRCDNTQAVFSLIQSMSADAAHLRLGGLATLGSLYQLMAQIGQSLQPAAPDTSREYYRKALWYMEGNYARPIQITDVADFVGLSRSQLFRVFQRVASTSPKACLDDIRMRRARMLLSNTNLSAEEIAASVGVSSSARLGMLFKAAFGQTLGQYRRSVQI